MTRTLGIGLSVLVAVFAGCGKAPSPAHSAPEGAPASPAAQTLAADPRTGTAQAFWSEFRRAVRADDRAKLLALVRFPFTTRGQLDDDPIVPYDQSRFWDVYARLLSQDTGLAMEPETVRQYIEEQEQPPPYALGGGQTEPVGEDAVEFYAGPLTFQKIEGRWYWVSAYEELQ